MKACELVGVSRRTIYNWLSSGKIEYVRTAGGSVRIFVDTLWRDPNNSERPAVQTMWQGGRPNPAGKRLRLSTERGCRGGGRRTKGRDRVSSSLSRKIHPAPTLPLPD